MSTTYINSNLAGKNSTETITNFATIGDSSTALVGASVTSSGAVSGTSFSTGTTPYTGAPYIKVDTSRYLIFGKMTTQASVENDATSISASVKGSLYVGEEYAWVFTSDTTASKCLM